MDKLRTLFAFAFIMLAIVGCGSDSEEESEEIYTPEYDFVVDNLYYKVTNMSDGICELVGGDDVKGNFTIPKSVTYDGKSYIVGYIDERAFNGNANITSVTFPNTVEWVQGFKNCVNLTSVNIPEGVTLEDDHGFTILEGVEGIGSFADCKKLTTISIPNGVTTITSKAFSGCTGLTSINIGNGIPSYEHGFRDPYKEYYDYDDYPFRDCVNLGTITVGCYNAYEIITSYTKAHYSTVVVAQDYYDKGNLSPAFGFEDYDYAVDGFSGGGGNLSKIIIKTTEPLVWGGQYDIPFEKYQSVEIIVPAEMLSYYQSAEYWKDFKNLKSDTSN